MTLLERIAVLRESNGGISINKLEKEAGLTRGSMCKWDIHEPSRDRLTKVANYFGVTVDYLLGKSAQDIYSIAFRKNLEDALDALDADAFIGEGTAEQDYRWLRYIADGDFPLTLETACKAADVLGESLDYLLSGGDENKKSPPSTDEDGLTGEESIILSLVSQMSPEKQNFLISWLQTELQQGE